MVVFSSIATLKQSGEPFEIDLIGAAILARIIGVLHVFVWYSNKEEIQKIRDRKLI